MKEVADPSSLCVACRLNRTIPDLDDADNARYWAAIEAAKHRLVAQLLALGLPVKSKVEEDTERGLMFDFLRSRPGKPAVMTGHANGLITLNIEEADDAKREKIKHDLREPYRTLLGHFRHEVGHYYWDLLVRDSEWLQPFRQVFGDERADYAESLKRHYKNGPPADWSSSYISVVRHQPPLGRLGGELGALPAPGRQPRHRDWLRARCIEPGARSWIHSPARICTHRTTRRHAHSFRC